MHKLLLTLSILTATAACSNKGGSSAELPAECTQYSQLVDKVASCDQMKTTRDGFAKTRDKNMQRWKATFDGTETARGELSKICGVRLHALEPAVPAACK